jgi:hypothetical protein
MKWRLILPNSVYFVIAYLVFLSILMTPAKSCTWFNFGVYGSFAIAIICAWLYTYKFIQTSLPRWQEFMQITVAKLVFFFVWGVTTIISLDFAIESACRGKEFFPQATLVEFKEYGAGLLVLILFLASFGFSLIINLLFWIVERKNQ